MFADLECWIDETTWVQVARMIGDAMQLLHDQALPAPTKDAVHVSATTLLIDLDGTVAARPRRRRRTAATRKG